MHSVRPRAASLAGVSSIHRQSWLRRRSRSIRQSARWWNSQSSRWHGSRASGGAATVTCTTSWSAIRGSTVVAVCSW
eukprot:11031399-Alexandrium_andersonii.AAC.1